MIKRIFMGQWNWMPWKNTGEVAVGPYELIQFDGAEVVNGIIVRHGKQPDGTLNAAFAVNGPWTVQPGGRHNYQSGPEVMVIYDGTDPNPGDRLGAKSGEGKAFADYPACLTVIGVYNTAYKLAKCQLHKIDSELIGKLDAALEQGGSATVSIWAGAGGSEADTGINVTAFDWFLSEGADDIAAGKKVLVRIINGIFYVVEAECP